MTVKTVSEVDGAKQSLRLLRTKHMATIFRITRGDGGFLLLTDHDRPITFNEELYLPLTLSSISSETRESGVKNGTQVAKGIIDGVVIKARDLQGHQYRGAVVKHKLIDWRNPLHVFYAETKRIRQIYWDGSQWSAIIEGIVATIQQPTGGRFGGTFSTTCPYRLGDASTCKADISLDTITTAVVQLVVSARNTVQFTTASWPGIYEDNYYKEGELQWVSGANAGLICQIIRYVHSTREVEILVPASFDMAVGDVAIVRPGCDGIRGTCEAKFRQSVAFSGTTTSVGTTTTIICATLSATLTSSILDGLNYYVMQTSGTMAGVERLIVSNTTTQLTVTPPLTASSPIGAAFVIRRSNIVNFGGSPYDPDAGRVLLQVP